MVSTLWNWPARSAGRLLCVAGLGVAFVAACHLAGCVNVQVKAPSLNSGAGSSSQGTPSPPSQLPPPGEAGGIRGIVASAAGSILGAERGVIFYAYDTLAYPHQSVHLAARAQSAENLKGLIGARIGFFNGQSRLVGDAYTGPGGHAIVSWTPPGEGNFNFTARILAAPEGAKQHKEITEVTPAPLLVAARDKETPFVVIDLDRTIVQSGFWRVLLGGAKVAPDSVEVVNRIAGQYAVIYLTHRPDLLTSRSKSWLREHGYAPGPLLVSDLGAAFGDSGRFKTAKLAAIREAFPNVAIGIGDRVSDAQAYAANGLTAYLLVRYKSKPQDMRRLAGQIRQLGGNGRIQVVSGWREVEAGIFHGRRFPPEAYADWLYRHADSVAAESRSRDAEDDD